MIRVRRRITALRRVGVLSDDSAQRAWNEYWHGDLGGCPRLLRRLARMPLNRR